MLLDKAGTLYVYNVTSSDVAIVQKVNWWRYFSDVRLSEPLNRLGTED